jgi:hypothetical protein
VISRVEDGEIAEDWAASDSLEIARQLGLRRTLLLGVRLAAESRTNLAPPSLDIG